MFTLPEQFTNASKATLEAQLALMSGLAGKTADSVAKIADLNLAAFKSSLEEGNAAAKQFFAAKDPQEWLSLSAAYAQPATEKAQAYIRHLASIASEIQAELTKATESQLADIGRKATEMVEELAKTAPPGTENAFALFKTAVGNVGAGYEQFSKSTKQAAETLETQLNNVASQFTAPVVKAAARNGAKK